MQWAAIATGGGASSQVVRTISSLSAFNALTQEVKDSKESIAFLAIPGKNGAEWSAQDGNVKLSHFYLATPLLDDCLILDLTALGSYYAIPTATTAATLEISPGQRLVWTLEADSTLSAKALDETHWATAQIEISTGSYKVTAGSNLVVVDTLTANAVNVCEVRWRAGAARLRVVDVISAGGDTPVQDDFPKSFTVTASQGLNGQACLGTYTRTGDTLALDGVDYPVYSYTSSSGKVHYIHISKYVYEGMQSVATSWILDTRTTFTAESGINVAEVYGTCKLKDGTYEPRSADWNGNQGAVTVSWEM